MANQLEILKLMAKLHTDTAITYLQTLADGEQTSSYIKGAIDMYHHLGWEN